VIIARFKLPTLIVTLGTQTIFKGILLAYVGTRYLGVLPPSLDSISSTNIVTVTVYNSTASGVLTPMNASINVLVIPVIIISLAVAYMLKHTMFGRGIYAIGGDYEAARRAGFPVMRIQILLYMLSGALAATAGVFHIAFNRSANAQDLVGDELLIIAAVVLGGASIFGGRGSVFGTMLGVVLIQLINNTLILVGVPQVWQRAAVGILLLIGITIQAYSNKKQKKKFNVTIQAEELRPKK
jgi:simple sugar transport system permease protein